MPIDIRTALAGHYELDREIGAGGMATVYAARDTRHDRGVAVKVLRPELAGAISAERFLREITIAARLQHPHIVGLIDSGIVEGLPYYVMPLIHGDSLRARLAAEGELPLDEGLQVLRHVLDALSYAHGQGIIHRDIKGENVLLSGYASPTASGKGRWHAMVADFGIAKALTEAGAESGLTFTGISIGTPASMSPEQAAADPHVDQRSDMYSVGVIAYEMFAGIPPFSGATAQHLIAAHMTREPEPPSRYRASIPSDIERFILRCLEKHPADRWQTADEALAYVDGITRAGLGQVTHSTAARPASVVERRYRLTNNVCRELDRTTLDPRIIGAEMQYADNQIENDVLLVLLHGTGQDHGVFREIMETLPYRCIAPTLLGFEPRERSQVVLPLAAHLDLIRVFMRDTVAEVEPRTTILLGFSAGGDMALLLPSTRAAKSPLVDGVVSLGCNLSFDTCFVTRLWSQLGSNNEAEMLNDLQRFGMGARTLEEWLKIHEYLLNVFRKFGPEVAAVRLFSQDIVGMFQDGGEAAFATLFREASRRVSALRCVWEDSELCARLVQELRLHNLDSGVLGDHYRDDALFIEKRAGHFDLLEPTRVHRHVQEMLAYTR